MFSCLVPSDDEPDCKCCVLSSHEKSFDKEKDKFHHEESNDGWDWESCSNFTAKSYYCHAVYHRSTHTGCVVSL